MLCNFLLYLANKKKMPKHYLTTSCLPKVKSKTNKDLAKIALPKVFLATTTRQYKINILAHLLVNLEINATTLYYIAIKPRLQTA